MRILTEAAQADRDEWTYIYKDHGCTCFLAPPCSYCIHPGNPGNQEEDEFWEEEPYSSL